MDKPATPSKSGLLKTGSTILNLLADDGILNVTFAGILTAEQYVALTEATSQSTTLHALERSLQDLAEVWGIATVTQIVSQNRWPAS